MTIEWKGGYWLCEVKFKGRVMLAETYTLADAIDAAVYWLAGQIWNTSRLTGVAE